LLADLLAMPDSESAADAKPAPAPAPGSKPGGGVLCRVDRVAREKIPWLGDHASDYFYYDSFIGVTEVRPLPYAL
jgi:hypothetical protein